MSNYITSLFNLAGKVVLLTGAGGHLVGDMSRATGRASMKVVRCDVKLVDAQRTVDQIAIAGGTAIAVELDVRQPAAFDAALAATIKAFGRLDCVLNGTGSNAPTPWTVDLRR